MLQFSVYGDEIRLFRDNKVTAVAADVLCPCTTNGPFY